MFDIGFWELTVIAVVALLVVGPEEFPVLVRQCIRGLAKLRRMVSSVREDLEYEVQKTEELKRLIAREVELEKMHGILDETRRSLSTDVAAGPSDHTSRDQPSNHHELDTQGASQAPTQSKRPGSSSELE